MSRALLAVVVAAAVLATPVPASSGASTTTAAAPRVSASAWYLVGPNGDVLAAHRARERRAIASITKLMTAAVALERAAPSDLMTVDPRAAGIGESTAFLRAGERLSVADVIRATLIPSGNDGALALAYHVGRGSSARFVELMNAKARELGLTDTRFRNPHGLDEPGHVSSARDATILLRYALGIPFLRRTLESSSVELPGGRVVPSTDDLLDTWPPLIGGKTGQTRNAGWSQAGAASGRGVTVYGTILGADSRAARSRALRSLLEHGIGRYRRVTAIDAGRVYAEVQTGYGRPAAQLVASRSQLETVRDDARLVERVIAPVSASLPVQAGEKLGRVEIWDGNRLLASASLAAAEDVSEPGLLRKVVWHVRTTLANLWGIVS